MGIKNALPESQFRKISNNIYQHAPGLTSRKFCCKAAQNTAMWTFFPSCVALPRKILNLGPFHSHIGLPISLTHYPPHQMSKWVLTHLPLPNQNSWWVIPITYPPIFKIGGYKTLLRGPLNDTTVCFCLLARRIRDARMLDAEGLSHIAS